MTRIDMPMQLKDIPRFEKQNNISASVYGWEPVRKDEDGKKSSALLTLNVSLKKLNFIMWIS